MGCRPGAVTGPLFTWAARQPRLIVSPKESIRRAVIDVGTNSVKLLVADTTGPVVLPVWEGSHQTRLGQSFYQTHRLQAGAIAKTAQAVAEFAARAGSLQAKSLRVIATSAARDALNAGDLVSAIHQACGLDTEIITGDQEADWAFRGVTTDASLRKLALLLLDVGGGSTEFILGAGQQRHFRESFPLGTVRLLEELPHSDPPGRGELAAYRQWVRDFLAARVQPKLQPAVDRERSRLKDQQPIQLIGSGGTASILGCMEGQLKTFDRARLESTRLTLQRVRWHVEHLWSLPLKDRQQIVGLPPNRADVILAGAVIYEGVLEHFGFPELRITTRGLRFAAVMEGG